MLCSAIEQAVRWTTRTQASGAVYGRQATRTAKPQHLLPVLKSFRAAGSPDLFMASPGKLNISAYAVLWGALYKGIVINTRHQLLRSMRCSSKDARVMFAECNGLQARASVVEGEFGDQGSCPPKPGHQILQPWS